MPDAPALLAAARDELARLPTVLDTLLGDLSRDDWVARPALEEWSPLEIVCHLGDEEVEDFRARVRVVVEGADRFVPIDPERWAVERRYREQDSGGALATFRRQRTQSLDFLAGIPAARLTRTIDHGTVGRLSGLDLLAAWVTHDRLHLAQLAATLARLWANRWAPARAAYAGPIPYGEQSARPGPA